MAVTVSTKELHRVVCTAIISKKGKYLILQRSLSEKAFPGKWTVPGGGVHPEDYIHEKASGAGQWYFALTRGLRREIKEETGLAVSNLEYLLDLTFVRPDGVPVVTLSYFAPYKSGKLKINSDHIQSAWVSLKEAKKYDLIPGIYEEMVMVEMINKKIKKTLDREKLFKTLEKKSQRK